MVAELEDALSKTTGKHRIGLAPFPFRGVAHFKRRSFRRPRVIFHIALNAACVDYRIH